MKGILLASLTMALSASTGTQGKGELCNFVPKNDRYIPAFTKDGAAQTGITQDEFNGILDRIQKIYGPIIQAKGGTLQINRLWDDGTVNASAERNGNTWVLNMYGGMARDALITPDGFMLVACHETGHHLGGKPKFQNWWPPGDDWASVEGQADYFGTMKCMRRMYLDMSDAELHNFESTNAYAQKKCNDAFTDAKDQTICLRSAEAGLVLGDVLADLGGTAVPTLETPSTAVFNGIDSDHPEAQCRTDTYFQGSLCTVGYNVDFSDSDQISGACSLDTGFTQGVRPKCWFNPAKKRSRPRPGVSSLAHKQNVFY